MVFPVWLLDGGTVFGIHQHERPAPDERFRDRDRALRPGFELSRSGRHRA
jgi:hypothetical protein